LAAFMKSRLFVLRYIWSRCRLFVKPSWLMSA
jgi:hypothetical protein